MHDVARAAALRSGWQERGRAGGRETGAVTDVEVGMVAEDAVRKEFAEPGVRPTVDDELGDEVEIGARIHIVGDASADDRKDGGGAFAPFVQPRE